MTDLVESEDELLDPQPAPGGDRRARVTALVRRLRGRAGAGAGSGAEADAEDGAPVDPLRRQRMTRAGALAVALVAAAGTAGVAVHKTDLHRNAAREQDRLLLHLLGGGASLTYAGIGARDGVSLPDRFDAPMATDLTVGLRNDGARPVEVTGVRIRQPGVDVVDPAPTATVKPGESVAFTTRVAVHCTAPDLPRAPAGATVTVRTVADHGGAVGKPTDLPLTFTTGSGSASPGFAEALPESAQGQIYMIGSYVTDSFYQLCGSVLARMPQGITAGAASTDASPRNPVLHYTLHVAGTPGAQQVVTAPDSAPAVAGVTATADLREPVPIGAGGADVTITDKVTDCAAFGRFLAIHGGAATAPMWLGFAAPIAVQPADPRFRVAGLSGTVMDGFNALTTREDDIQEALLGQVAAACPNL